MAEAWDAALAVIPEAEAKDFLEWADGIARDGEAVRLMKEMLYSPDPRFRLPALFRVLDLAVGTPTPRAPQTTPQTSAGVQLVFTVAGPQTRFLSEPAPAPVEGAEIIDAPEATAPDEEPAKNVLRFEAVVLSPSAHVRNLLARGEPVPWRTLSLGDLAEVEGLLSAKLGSENDAERGMVLRELDRIRAERDAR